MKKRGLDDIAAEIDGISSVLCVLADEYMNEDVHSAPMTTGNALFALEQHLSRISEELSLFAGESAKALN